jgi:hypothetical protein
MPGTDSNRSIPYTINAAGITVAKQHARAYRGCRIILKRPAHTSVRAEEDRNSRMLQALPTPRKNLPRWSVRAGRPGCRQRRRVIRPAEDSSQHDRRQNKRASNNDKFSRRRRRANDGEDVLVRAAAVCRPTRNAASQTQPRLPPVSHHTVAKNLRHLPQNLSNILLSFAFS